MNPYVKNPSCSCSRCRAARLLFPALIITVGVLFLLHVNSAMEIDRSWPVLLLVGGLFSFLGASASTENHVQPYGTMTMPVAQPLSVQTGYAYAQPTVAPSGFAQPGYPQTSPAQTPGTDVTPSSQSDPIHNDSIHTDPAHNDPQVNS